MLRLRPALAALCATLVLASCGGTDDTTARDDTGGEEETVSPSPSPPAPDSPAAKAVADLARQLDVPEEEVVVESQEEVTWKDGSLGCAEKGTMYTQALVDGNRITLRVADQTYEYHSGGSKPPFLCEEPTQ